MASLLMFLSRAGMALAVSRRRVFPLVSSQAISLFMTKLLIRLFAPVGNRLEFSYLDHAHEKRMRVY